MADQNKSIINSDGSDSVKIDIASLLAHDVKSPIRYIQLITGHYLESWSEHDDADKQETLELIHNSTRDITRLLENIINWSKLKSADFELNISNFNLYKLAQEEIGLQNTILHLKKVEVKNNIPKGTTLKSDPFVLRMALQNIISNAIKFSHKHDLVTISLQIKDDSVCICIEDSGTGLNEEDIEKLLADEFLTQPGTADERGTGVGTFLTKRIIGLLGAKINIKSRLDAGTIVSISFPKSSFTLVQQESHKQE